MIRIQHTIDIDRRPETVFAYLSDLDRLPEWQKGVIRSHVTTAGPVRAGTRFEETAKVGPWRLDSECEVMKFDPPHAMCFVAKGKQIDYEGEFTLQPSGEGTRLSVTGSARLKGGWRLMQPVMAGDLKRETEHELRMIKRLLEGTGSVGGTAD